MTSVRELVPGDVFSSTLSGGDVGHLRFAVAVQDEPSEKRRWYSNRRVTWLDGEGRINDGSRVNLQFIRIHALGDDRRPSNSFSRANGEPPSRFTGPTWVLGEAKKGSS